MPGKTIPIYLFSLLLPLLAFAGGPQDISLGSAQLNGQVTTYLEMTFPAEVTHQRVMVTPCYHVTRQGLTTEEPSMIAFSQLNGSGNLVVRKWFRFISLEIRAEAVISRLFVPGFLDNLTPGEGHDLFLFHWDHGSKYPSIVLTIDPDGFPSEYIVLEDYNGESLRVVTYGIDARPVYEDRYCYDGTNLMSMERQADGDSYFRTDYFFSPDGLLLSSSTRDGHEREINRICYDNYRRMTSMSISDPVTDTSYSYEYTHRGSPENYVSQLKMSNGKLPYYFFSRYGVENGRIVWQESITGSGPTKRNSRKLKHYGEISHNCVFFTYNQQGDVTRITGVDGSGYDSTNDYLYDETGNWYFCSTVNGRPPLCNASVSLRAFKYKED